MPEIKNTFTAGKMNKDLDERLVPKGEYIDAMNVEVTTSENDDVGTVQTVSGNILLGGNNLIPLNSVCIGSVTDNANDSIYWLVATDKFDPSQEIATGNIMARFNAIFEYNTSNSPSVNPVLVDIHQVHAPAVKFTQIATGMGIDQYVGAKNILFLNEQFGPVYVGMEVTVTDAFGVTRDLGKITKIIYDPAGNPGTLIFTEKGDDMVGNMQFVGVEFNGNLTGWNTDTLVTGINIIDEMLFWTDNESEPKKINITRCKDGTHLYSTTDVTNVDGPRHTDLIVNGDEYGKIQQSHITVIKPKPKSPIVLDFNKNILESAGINGRLNSNGRATTNNSAILKQGDIHTFTSVSTLDSFSFNNNNKFDYDIGDIVLIKYNSSGSISNSDFPITEYNIRGRVTELSNNTFTAANTHVRVKILDVNYDGYPSLTGSSNNSHVWAIQKEINEENLFELKFPRFSYRWKFEDGEYSTFAPWSEIAFIPGNYQYLPKEGFNIGMVNQLKELTLFDFITPDMPKDVVQIDLLYKDSLDATVYIINSVKPNDQPDSGLSQNIWRTPGSQGKSSVAATGNAELPYGKYKITTENIFAAVASNQLIRNWDNVPRKALAQEIIGNRLIYGNYVRNFNLSPGGNFLFSPDISLTYKYYNNNYWHSKTVKSIREYQVGVVYTDEFGRETPVFTSSDSIVKIPKLHSSKSNILYSKINHFPPRHADAYKFYVKETTSKYYNLVMDRWYNAEDGNIWLSFNSHDRNKVDEETYLYLKRGHDGAIVNDTYKYKILDIKNEAPEFIRTTQKQFGIKPNNVGNWNFAASDFNAGVLYNDGGVLIDAIDIVPEIGKKSFSISPPIISDSNWIELNLGTVFTADTTIDETFRIRFLKHSASTTVTHRGFGQFFYDQDPDQVSNWYKVDSYSQSGLFNVSKAFGNDVLFALDSAGTAMADDISIEIARESAERLPEFDGRFFVKVLKNDIVEKNIIQTELYSVTSSQPLYYFNQPSLQDSNNDNVYDDANGVGLKLYKSEAATANGTVGTMEPISDADYNTIKGGWEDYFGLGLTHDDEATNGPKWFIDKLKYSGSKIGSFLTLGSNAQPYQLSDGIEGTGQGVDDGNKTIDISFCGIGINDFATTNPWFYPGLHHADGGTGGIPSGSYRVWHFYDGDFFSHRPSSQHAFQMNHQVLDVGMNGSNKYVEWTNDMKIGGQFKFSEDTNNTIYTIVGLEVFNRWNYLDEELFYDGAPPPSGMPFTGPDSITRVDYNDDAATIDYALGYDGNDYSSTGLGTVKNWIHNLYHPNTAANRRVTFRLHLDKSINDASYDDTQLQSDSNNATAGCSLQFVTPTPQFMTSDVSDTPAVWETEPKTNEGLDVYYEASQIYPRYLNSSNISSIISIGDTVETNNVSVDWDSGAGNTPTILGWDEGNPGRVLVGKVDTTGNFSFDPSGTASVNIRKKDNQGHYINVDMTRTGVGGPNPNTQYFDIERDTHKWGRTLDWFNAYSFGNGVESNTIRDDFNQITIGNGVKASTTVGWQFEEERLKNKLIFSGVYNAKTGLNDLNQFIEAEGITKDINPEHGSIQKLQARDSDLVTFCEDKVIKVLANKDAVFNADDNPQLISTPNVLGQAVPFIGDYGINTNPESFAKENFRSYFVDRKRGVVLRLSRDGLTPISENGMKDWFRDHLPENERIYGSYDSRKSHYNVSLRESYRTIAFAESSNGWVSFRSFIPESGETMNNEYFTFKHGKIYQHHQGSMGWFYADPGSSHDPHVTFVFNEAPSVVKSFRTLNYEGSQAEIVGRTDDNEYYNLNNKKGWSVTEIRTDQQEGRVPEFIEKEGKWFNYIKGTRTNLDNINTDEFSFQGISVLSAEAPLILDQAHYGCMNLSPTDPSYNPFTNIDDGTICEESP